MEEDVKSEQDRRRNQATQHLSEAHQMLKSLREKLDQHPELDDAIERLEMALSILAVETGGML